jgi:hypothetical protein
MPCPSQSWRLRRCQQHMEPITQWRSERLLLQQSDFR